MTDGELVRQSLDGRTEARNELVHRWTARVLAFCHQRVRCRQTAEDLAQESLLRAFRALATHSEPEKFGPWLCGLALRVCLDWHKSRAARETASGSSAETNAQQLELTDPTPSPDEVVARRQQQSGLLKAVDELPEEYREVILLYYYQDATYQDLAQQIGTSTATVNARLTKARALLRQRLTTMWRS
jgi:RNA polymerase sigma-70 factor (ECF subfamily)